MAATTPRLDIRVCVFGCVFVCVCVRLFVCVCLFVCACLFVPMGAEALYVTCRLQNCTEANKGKPFPGFIDPNSLVVQDEYVFVQVSDVIGPVEVKQLSMDPMEGECVPALSEMSWAH